MKSSIHDYEKPSVTTDLVLFRVASSEVDNKRLSPQKRLQVLLVERTEEPSKGFALPGGFLPIDKRAVENMLLKLKAKSGIEGNFYMEQLYTFEQLKRDARGRVISISYVGLCNEETYKEGESLLQHGWYDVTSVLSDEFGDLSFDHKDIIHYALQRLQGKLEYTDVAFNLLSSEFTMQELQNVYEVILGREINNFRRKIQSSVVALGKKTEGKQHRPAELYSKNTTVVSKF